VRLCAAGLVILCPPWSVHAQRSSPVRSGCERFGLVLRRRWRTVPCTTSSPCPAGIKAQASNNYKTLEKESNIGPIIFNDKVEPPQPRAYNIPLPVFISPPDRTHHGRAHGQGRRGCAHQPRAHPSTPQPLAKETPIDLSGRPMVAPSAAAKANIVMDSEFLGNKPRVTEP
jgi:hypothetical protein